MRACGACGRPALPLVPLLLGAPLVLGGAGAAVLLLAKDQPWQRAAVVAVGAAFAILAAGLLWTGMRIVNGSACPGCGRGR